jgi:hypothetical protein
MALLRALGPSEGGLELTGEDGRGLPRGAVEAMSIVEEEKKASQDESVLGGQHGRDGPRSPAKGMARRIERTVDR